MDAMLASRKMELGPIMQPILITLLLLTAVMVYMALTYGEK
jgi:hypothetical protein